MGKKALSVDDSKTIREMVSFTLKKEGFEVAEAEDGQDGLAKLSGPLDVIITDLNMPNMNGIEFISSVRADDSHAGLPMVMLTTEGQAETMRAGKKAGASGWIVKPFNELQLELTVKKFIG